MAAALKYIQHSMTVQLTLLVLILAQDESEFIYNGFLGGDTATHLHLDGLANIHPNGLLQMTNFSVHKTSHAFYPNPMTFKANTSSSSSSSSFSTTFVFAMLPQVPDHSGHGIVFLISPTMDFRQALSSEYLGLFNDSTNGLSSNHVFAVELDTVQNAGFGDISGNHVGVDANSLASVEAANASFYSDREGANKSLLLNSGKPMQVWIDFDEKLMLVNVTLAPLSLDPKPSKCLLSKRVNLSAILLDRMYVGFSSSTGLISNEHYLLGWSWSQSGRARDLDPSKLPPLPRFIRKKRFNPTFLVLLIVMLALLSVISVAAWVVYRKRYQELQEPWEREYAPHRFSYKDLSAATKGFRGSELLGVGGFGKVYRGVLPSTRAQVAVKRVSHDSRQGMREFVAEVASMRRLRHRNLVQLLGYCRRKGELLLVYDYMPNGSLDKFLFGEDERSRLSWTRRCIIIKGVASALLYLHEEWEQVVLHRDVKASNVLLDDEMNPRLGDFGLARLYDHSENPRTTHVVGTMGYIAPEVCRTHRPTTCTDVFAFGMLLLEVACGRRPIDVKAEFFLLDWVYDCWKRGAILEASDPRLEGCYDTKEMEMVLRLGMMCSHPKAGARPSMRHVVQVLEGVAAMPDIPPDYQPEGNGSPLGGWGVAPASWSSSLPSSSGTVSLGPSSSTNSVLHSGR